MPYSVKRSRPKQSEPAPMASLFLVTSLLGARVMERKSMNSGELAKLRQGALFHGVLCSPWIARLGGGYVVHLCAREVV